MSSSRTNFYLSGTFSMFPVYANKKTSKHVTTGIKRVYIDLEKIKEKIYENEAKKYECISLNCE